MWSGYVTQRTSCSTLEEGRVYRGDKLNLPLREPVATERLEPLPDDRPDHRTEIRDFRASRRAKITPQQAGLPTSGRRRVPGLRREEVAVVAGVSTEWYTRLEKGQKITALSERPPHSYRGQSAQQHEQQAAAGNLSGPVNSGTRPPRRPRLIDMALESIPRTVQPRIRHPCGVTPPRRGWPCDGRVPWP
ncbi:hypothetical protein GCM10010206_61130 [Streptomyces cinerochromogenes]|nr:hypothetical protein GCM10010206_61130 [Streptomyces cinerochromogenes]